jgi:DNA repair protein RecO (recombination protein O)
MAILKTEAIILKTWKLRETSLILSAYTLDFGKIKFVAKGARGSKSKLKGCLEPLSHVGIVFYEKKTRDLQLLTQAHLIDPHIHMVGDLKRTTLGFSAAELLDKGVAGEEPSSALFSLLTEVLAGLTCFDGFLEAVFWYFETHFIALMGYKPTWESCLVCKKSLGIEGGYFQAASGGLLCCRCGAAGGGLMIQGETLEILYFLQQSSLDETVQLRPTLRQKAEVRKMFALYFRTHIEHLRQLNALEIYFKMDRSDTSVEFETNASKRELSDR